MKLGFLWIAISLAAAACGNKSNTCVEGASVACACPGGGSGAQVCTSGAYGACTCNAPAAPAPAAPAPTPTETAPAPAAPAPAAAAPAAPAPAATPDDHRDHEKDLREARERFDRLTKDDAEVDHKLGEAKHAVETARSKSEREAAKARLDGLEKQKTDLDAQVAAAKVEVDRFDHHDHH